MKKLIGIIIFLSKTCLDYRQICLAAVMKSLALTHFPPLLRYDFLLLSVFVSLPTFKQLLNNDLNYYLEIILHLNIITAYTGFYLWLLHI